MEITLVLVDGRDLGDTITGRLPIADALFGQLGRVGGNQADLLGPEGAKPIGYRASRGYQRHLALRLNRRAQRGFALVADQVGRAGAGESHRIQGCVGELIEGAFNSTAGTDNIIVSANNFVKELPDILVAALAPRPAVVIADNAMRAASGTLALPCEM